MTISIQQRLPCRTDSLCQRGTRRRGGSQSVSTFLIFIYTGHRLLPFSVCPVSLWDPHFNPVSWGLLRFIDFENEPSQTPNPPRTSHLPTPSESLCLCVSVVLFPSLTPSFNLFNLLYPRNARSAAVYIFSLTLRAPCLRLADFLPSLK
jgi:hypothetical protein